MSSKAENPPTPKLCVCCLHCTEKVIHFIFSFQNNSTRNVFIAKVGSGGARGKITGGTLQETSAATFT